MSERDAADLSIVSEAPLSHPPELSGRVERLLGAIVTMAGARSATLRRLDVPGHRLTLVAAVQVPADFALRTNEMDASCGACGDVLRRNRSVVSMVPCLCARTLADDTETGLGAGLNRMLALPLRHDEQVCGVLSLYLGEGELLDPPLAGLLSSLCDLLGAALLGAEVRDQALVQRLTQERHLLANEVHDALAQNLTSIRMRTSLIRDAIAREDSVRVRNYLGEIDESLNVAQSRVRELITHFRTDMDERGLLPALEGAIAELSGLSGVRIELDNRISQLEMSVDHEQQVFYVVREALTNAVKHSGASEVAVRLQANRQGYLVEVEDNGIGLDASSNGEHGHFGLNIMRERAQGLNGLLELRSGRHGGTCIRLTFPRLTLNRKVPS
jgi:nitrate/nitrite-specific signal transduction histidine kinase